MAHWLGDCEVMLAPVEVRAGAGPELAYVGQGQVLASGLEMVLLLA